ncbi:MAG: TatD family hydrolase [Clostridia bacterium]|nr:TatD family hydrolase [Clostridia bacterium]
MNLFDSHCHLYDKAFDDDRDLVIRRMSDHRVFECALIGYDIPSSIQAISLCERYPAFVAAVGVHPEWVKPDMEEDIEALRTLCQHPSVRAIGEIGLDTHEVHAAGMEDQKRACLMQLDLAGELKLPTVFHVRGAHQDMIELLKARKGSLTPGIVHCFSGSWETAKIYLNLGMMISFSGTVTYDHAPRLQKAAAQVPLDRLLIETDSPYLAPVPHKGERNEPAHVALVLDKIAQIRGMDPDVLTEITTENARRFFAAERGEWPSIKSSESS